MRRKFSRISQGFTLIEILVVIAIVGILAALGTAAYGTARSQARDAQRRSDVRAIQNALQLYFNENASYPAGEWVYSSQGGTWISGLDGRYIEKMPIDPKVTSGNNCLPRDSATCFNYAYYSGGWTPCGYAPTNGRSYILTTRLETYKGSDLSQKQYYKPDGTLCSNWSENVVDGLLVVQPGG